MLSEEFEASMCVGGVPKSRRATCSLLLPASGGANDLLDKIRAESKKNFFEENGREQQENAVHSAAHKPRYSMQSTASDTTTDNSKRVSHRPESGATVHSSKDKDNVFTPFRLEARMALASGVLTILSQVHKHLALREVTTVIYHWRLTGELETRATCSSPACSARRRAGPRSSTSACASTWMASSGPC